MEYEQRAKYFEDLALDYRLGINHIRILIYSYDKTGVTVIDLCKHYKLRQPYCNRLLNELCDFGYMEKHSRDISSGRINYKILKKEA